MLYQMSWQNQSPPGCMLAGWKAGIFQLLSGWVGELSGSFSLQLQELHTSFSIPILWSRSGEWMSFGSELSHSWNAPFFSLLLMVLKFVTFKVNVSH